MTDHGYRPFSPDFPFSPATRADEWAAEREWREAQKVFGLPEPAPMPYDADDESVRGDVQC